ncbi:MAG TPA: hypothetical protein H9870_00740 [Candidatus Corynebacterium avicola]|uniref:Uncharacterized protein n=1 Tax=Candidatus Corynebacterium avicola TaxID=2838527 RepID=A0A9D1RKV1_9CORY|nr:hypothetical protein [Candidatus Corynebacterium avicola]
MSGYDLYQSLELSRVHPPEQLAEQLDQRIAELRGQGVQDWEPQLDEVLIARTVLGDAGRRTEYDHALDAAPGTAPEADVPWIRALAQRGAGGGWAVPGGNGAGQSSGAGAANALAVVDRYLTPIPLAAVSGVLAVLTFAVFFFSWGKASAQEQSATLDLSVNGFGAALMEIDSWASMTGRDTSPAYVLLSLVILILLVVGAVLLGLSRETRFGGLLVAVGGGLLTLYGLWALITKLGAEDLFGGEEDFGTTFKASVGAGAILGLILGLLTLAVGVLVVLRAKGSLLPQAWTSGKAASSATPAAPGVQDAPSESAELAEPAQSSDSDNDPFRQRPSAEQ